MADGSHSPSTRFLAQATNWPHPHHWPHEPQQVCLAAKASQVDSRDIPEALVRRSSTFSCSQVSALGYFPVPDSLWDRHSRYAT